MYRDVLSPTVPCMISQHGLGKRGVLQALRHLTLCSPMRRLETAKAVIWVTEVFRVRQFAVVDGINNWNLVTLTAAFE